MSLLGQQPLSPVPRPSQTPCHCSSPIIPMGLVMLLQHLHDPIEPLPEGVVPARQVLLRTPRKPQLGGPGNSQCPSGPTQSLSPFRTLLVPHSRGPPTDTASNPHPSEPESRLASGFSDARVGGDKNCPSWTVTPAQTLHFTDGDTWPREEKGPGILENKTRTGTRTPSCPALALTAAFLPWGTSPIPHSPGGRRGWGADLRQ